MDRCGKAHIRSLLPLHFSLISSWSDAAQRRGNKLKGWLFFSFPLQSSDQSNYSTDTPGLDVTKTKLRDRASAGKETFYILTCLEVTN